MVVEQVWKKAKKDNHIVTTAPFWSEGTYTVQCTGWLRDTMTTSEAPDHCPHCGERIDKEDIWV